jgi:transcriptional regulator with XRE-family HTH domain
MDHMAPDVAGRLGRNIKQLRTARGLTQQQMARLASLPRATWANLESGDANPTLQVLHAVALALSVSIEELIAMPKASARLYARGALPTRQRGQVEVRSLLPDPIPGMLIERLELRAGATLSGVPHTPGTREYLTCERGAIVLTASGETWRLEAGDVVVFRGDQRHGYANPLGAISVGYSVVVLAPSVS